jgi:predicted flap endonuclease-1-like 5' DNA nuclease
MEVIEMAENMFDLNIEDISGIGPQTKEKLNNGGIDLAVALPKEVEAILGGSEETANSLSK